MSTSWGIQRVVVKWRAENPPSTILTTKALLSHVSSLDPMSYARSCLFGHVACGVLPNMELMPAATFSDGALDARGNVYKRCIAVSLHLCLGFFESSASLVKTTIHPQPLIKHQQW